MQIEDFLKQALEALRSGDLVLTRDICETIQTQAEGEPGSLRLLGQVSFLEGDLEQAAACFERSTAAKPDQYSVWIKLGNIYTDLGRDGDAEKAYTQAIKTSPEPFMAYFSRAHIRNIMDRKEDAWADIDKGLEINPGYGQAYRMMTLQEHPATKNPAWQKDLEHKLSLGFFPPDQAIQVHYALAACFEAVNDKTKMWFHLNRANGLQKNRAIEWRDSFQTIVERSPEIFTANMMKKVLSGRKPSITPIFIVGLPRSGSTLLEKMLASHPKIAGAGETGLIPQVIGKVQDETLLGFPNGFELLEDDFLAGLADFYEEGLKKKADGKSYATDKLLSNGFFLGLIHILMPSAKIIHITRDPADTAFSIYKNYFWEQLTPEFCSLKSIGHYGRMFEKLMGYWKTLMPDSICQVRYEDLVENSEDELKRIIKFIGLPWDAACLNFENTRTGAKTLSQDQVRKAIYASSIGAGKQFEVELKPFFDSYNQD